jgi:hypothetical protein
VLLTVLPFRGEGGDELKPLLREDEKAPGVPVEDWYDEDEHPLPSAYLPSAVSCASLFLLCAPWGFRHHSPRTISNTGVFCACTELKRLSGRRCSCHALFYFLCHWLPSFKARVPHPSRIFPAVVRTPCLAPQDCDTGGGLLAAVVKVLYSPLPGVVQGCYLHIVPHAHRGKQQIVKVRRGN